RHPSPLECRVDVGIIFKHELHEILIAELGGAKRLEETAVLRDRLGESGGVPNLLSGLVDELVAAHGDRLCAVDRERPAGNPSIKRRKVEAGEESENQDRK